VLIEVGILKRIAVSATLRGSVLSVLDQAVCSLSGFLTGIIVARALLPEAFGVYSLYFTGILLLGGFQNALITAPARVLGVRPSGVDAGGYFRAQLRLQLFLSALLIAGSAIGLFLLYPDEVFVTLAFLLCLLLVQIQELARVVNLTRMTFRALLKLDLVTHGLRIGLLLAAMGLDVLSAGTALIVIAIACGVSLIVVGRSTYTAAAPAPFGQTARANWRYGRWILLETFAYSASTQIYIYLTALWVSTAAVGGLSAVQVLMNAVNVLLVGIMNFELPQARRRLIENDYDAWRAWLWKVGFLLAGCAAVFGIFTSIFAESLLAFIYSPAYGAFAKLMPIIAFQLFFAACNMVLSAAFRTAELPQVGFAAKAASTVVMLLIAYPLLTGWGVIGAAVGLVITQAMWTTVYAFYVARGKLMKVRICAAREGDGVG
jgi:O-antigen/teichoic acid export membrane protein